MAHIPPISVIADEPPDDGSVMIICWLKASGDYVHEGEPLCELETSKASVTLDAWTDGVLRIHVPAGTRMSITDEFCTIEPAK